MARESFTGVPPIYQSAMMKQIELLQRREFDLTAKFRYQFEHIFLDYRDRLQRYFAQHFVLSVNPEGQQVWDPVQATALDTQGAIDDSLEEVLDDLHDALVPDIEAESVEAEDDGQDLALWMLALGGLDTTDAPKSPPVAGAVLAGMALFRLRFAAFQRRLSRTLRGAIVTGETLPETLASYDVLTDRFQTTMVAWVQDQLLISQLRGDATIFDRYRPQLRGRLWYTRDDERVCAVCRPLHLRLTTKVPILDTHPRCCLAGTVVGHATARVPMQRLYEGPIVRIQTASGQELAVTPNHPILTQQGWVPANDLYEGCEVIRSRRGQRMLLRGGQDDVDVPALIEQVCETLFRASRMAAVEVETAAEDFHGDGAYSQVAVVGANRRLMVSQQESPVQPLRQQTLGRHYQVYSSLSSEGTTTAFLKGDLPPLRYPVGGLHLLRPLRFRHLLPLQLLCLGLRAETNARLREQMRQPKATDVELLRDLQQGVPFAVQTDRVVHVERVEFHGMVYNLETAEGYYTANGIVVKNCRCIVVPIPTHLVPTFLSFEAYLAAREALTV